MKSVKNLLIVVTLGSIIAVTGCTAQKAKDTVTGTNTQTETAAKQTAPEEGQQASIDGQMEKSNATTTGLENMRSVLKDMNTQLNNKEEDKAIKTSDKLEENWSTFEDGIKDSNKDLYQKVEDPLGTIQAAVKVTPLDTKVLTAAMGQLDTVLEQIQKSIASASAPVDRKQP